MNSYWYYKDDYLLVYSYFKMYLKNSIKYINKYYYLLVYSY